MDYKQMSTKILELVGGVSNIESFTNCMTRLRINVHNTDLVNESELKKIDGVMGVVLAAQTQIIVGPGHAQRLSESFSQISGLTTNQPTDNINNLASDMKAKVKSTQTSKLQKALAQIGNIFVPIIPAFVGCGLIIALANIMIMVNPDVKSYPWFLVFQASGFLIGGMLQIIVGFNAAKEFGGTPVLGAVAGALLYSPSLAGANGVPLTVPVVGITLAPALGGVLGVIFAAYVFTLIEKNLRKVIPASFDLFLIPFLTILVGGIISIIIIMPIAAVIMKSITWLLVDICLGKGGIVGGFVLAASFLPLVMLGLHQGLTPVHADLITTTGYTVLLPILAMAGAGQVGSAIAVYVKTDNKELKKVISSGIPIGMLGVGEPLIYGVSLPLFYPFITACLGAGFGGAVIAFASKTIAPVGAIAIGPSGLILAPLISNNMILWYLGGILTAYVFGFVLTYLFGFNKSMESRLN